jgi:hypothetical protein
MLAQAPADSSAVPTSISANINTVLVATTTVHRTRNRTKEAFIAVSPLLDTGSI